MPQTENHLRFTVRNLPSLDDVRVRLPEGIFKLFPDPSYALLSAPILRCGSDSSWLIQPEAFQWFSRRTSWLVEEIDLYVAVDCDGLFLFPIRTPPEEGIDIWSVARNQVNTARAGWVELEYRGTDASHVLRPQPPIQVEQVWPNLSFSAILSAVFEGRVVSSRQQVGACLKSYRRWLDNLRAEC